MKYTATLIAALTSVSGSSIAADFPPRAAIGAQSSYLGLETSDLALYRRQAGPGATAVGSQLLGQFGSHAQGAGAVTGSGKCTTTQGSDALQFQGDDGWTLKVYRDGTAAEYRNWKYRTTHTKTVPIEQQPTLDTLAGWGRDFISANLAGIITLGPNEALVESHALFERKGSLKKGAKLATTTTGGAIVVFTRTINGMPIVGEGSKVEVSFTVDGVPWAFSYDWPSYSITTTRQQVLPLAEIRHRQSRLLPIPADVAKQTETRFECGYFDMGVKRRGSTTSPVLQGGCISQHEFKIVGDPLRHSADPTDGLLTSAHAVSIPAGVDVEPDDDWPEAKTVRGANQSMKAERMAPGSNQSRTQSASAASN